MLRKGDGVAQDVVQADALKARTAALGDRLAQHRTASQVSRGVAPVRF